MEVKGKAKGCRDRLRVLVLVRPKGRKGTPYRINTRDVSFNLQPTAYQGYYPPLTVNSGVRTRSLHYIPTEFAFHAFTF